jgi:uncharacterized membrane protein YadS
MTDLRKLRIPGGRPLILAVLGWIFISLLALVLIKLLG